MPTGPFAGQPDCCSSTGRRAPGSARNKLGPAMRAPAARSGQCTPLPRLAAALRVCQWGPGPGPTLYPQKRVSGEASFLFASLLSPPALPAAFASALSELPRCPSPPRWWRRRRLPDTAPPVCHTPRVGAAAAHSARRRPTGLPYLRVALASRVSASPLPCYFAPGSAGLRRLREWLGAGAWRAGARPLVECSATRSVRARAAACTCVVPPATPDTLFPLARPPTWPWMRIGTRLLGALRATGREGAVVWRGVVGRAPLAYAGCVRIGLSWRRGIGHIGCFRMESSCRIGSETARADRKSVV